MLATRPSLKPAIPTANLIIPELKRAKTAVLNALISVHPCRAYKHAVEEFIAWYCSEPLLGFNRSAVLHHR
jgi:hypothetical protein